MYNITVYTAVASSILSQHTFRFFAERVPSVKYVCFVLSLLLKNSRAVERKLEGMTIRLISCEGGLEIHDWRY